jgi:hypothetical protein
MASLLDNALPALRFATSNVLSLMLKRLIRDQRCLVMLAKVMQAGESEIETAPGQFTTMTWGSLSEKERLVWVARAKRTLVGLHDFLFTQAPQDVAARGGCAARPVPRRR